MRRKSNEELSSFSGSTNSRLPHLVANENTVGCPKEREIADAFINLVNSRTPYEPVTVVELSQCVGINRKTFYNHFENIDTLVLWIFRTAMVEMLNRPSFNGCTFAYPNPSLHDKWPDWPFFVQTNIHADTEFRSQVLYFKLLGDYLYRNRIFYEHIFSSPCYTNLENYLVSLFLPAIRADAINMLDGRQLPDVILDFLAEYHTLGIIGRVVYRYSKTHTYSYMDENLGNYMCYSHLLMKYSIENLSSYENSSTLLYKFKDIFARE